MPLRLLVVLTLLLAGCGRTPDDRTSDDTAAFDLLTQTGSYDRVNGVLVSAEHRLIGECMSKRGRSYLPPDQVPATPDSTVEGRRAGGYGLYEQYTGTKQDVTANDAHVSELAPAEQDAYEEALVGTDGERRAIKLSNGGTVSFAGGGCQAEAQRTLYGDVVEWARITYVPQALHLTLAKQVEKDQEYLAAIREWARCMSGRGFQVTSPEAAQDELKDLYGRQGPSPELRAREIATAVADGECAEQGGVPDLVLRIKHRLVAELPEVDRVDLHRVAEAWTEAAAKA